ncbi:MAG TPA: hypothetical protein VG246_12970 [Acidimicrobiales bacterium]|nr:hypothetical protein [Acidimicrobiales bacterium]
MAKLTARQRRAMPKSSFAIPSKAPGPGSYPIGDKAHAKNALARSSGKPAAATVKSAVARKFPSIKQSGAKSKSSAKRK